MLIKDFFCFSQKCFYRFTLREQHDAIIRWRFIRISYAYVCVSFCSRLYVARVYTFLSKIWLQFGQFVIIHWQISCRCIREPRIKRDTRADTRHIIKSAVTNSRDRSAIFDFGDFWLPSRCQDTSQLRIWETINFSSFSQTTKSLSDIQCRSTPFYENRSRITSDVWCPHFVNYSAYWRILRSSTASGWLAGHNHDYDYMIFTIVCIPGYRRTDNMTSVREI